MITNIQNIDFKKKPGKGKAKVRQTNKVLPVQTMAEDIEYRDLLDECRAYWDSLRNFRDRRRRNRKYVRGDQWHELITDPDTGKAMTEENYIKSKGKIPFKQNLIRQLVKNLLGQYRSNPTETIVIPRQRTNAEVGDMLSNAIQYVHDINYGKELDARCFEEKTLSGCAVQKIGYQYIKTRDQEDVWYSNVNVNRLFFNNDVADPRLTDLRVIGEIIDTTLDDVIATFARSRKEEEDLANHFKRIQDRAMANENAFTAASIDNLDFYVPSEPNHVRIYEVWQLVSEWRVYAHDYAEGTYTIVDYSMKEIEQMNKERIAMAVEQGWTEEEAKREFWIDAREKKEQIWYVRFLTPYGKCLYQMETPYQHQEHPYAMVAYPMLDGEVWGLVEDVIDQQRYINRLISLLDFIMGASAKGVLLVPEAVIPEGWNLDDYAEKWGSFNGVIPIKIKPGQENMIPKQIHANSTNIGAHEMLALQMKLFQEITGVSDAIQGRGAKSGTPSSLYAQQAQNSMINVKDFMESFTFFKQKRDMKVLKLIKQYYKERRYLAIAGQVYEDGAQEYDPDKVKDIEAEVVVAQGTDTPVYRQVIDETLHKLLEMQAIDIEMFLEHSSLPMADKLLQTIRQRREEAAGQIPPEIAAQIQQQANPEAMNMVNQMMGSAA